MTEAEWLGSTDPTAMLEFLRDRASDRRLRLFACAYCRLHWELLADERSRKAVQVAERYVDGVADESERKNAATEVLSASSQAALEREWTSESSPSALAAYAATAAWYTVFYSARAATITTCDADATDWYVENGIEMPHPELLREIFGNPFRLATFDPRWLTPNVAELAQRIYDERAFDQMPILADSLEAAGCDDHEILDHCRGSGSHVRGCWVVDAILGKS